MTRPAQMAKLNQQMVKMMDPRVLHQMGEEGRGEGGGWRWTHVFQHSSLLLTSLKSKKCRELPIFQRKLYLLSEY